LEFITISLDEVAEIRTKVIPFLNQMGAAMPAYILHIVDPENAINIVDPSWGGAWPATFLFDRTGKNSSITKAVLIRLNSGRS